MEEHLGKILQIHKEELSSEFFLIKEAKEASNREVRDLRELVQSLKAQLSLSQSKIESLETTKDTLKGEANTEKRLAKLINENEQLKRQLKENQEIKVDYDLLLVSYENLKSESQILAKKYQKLKEELSKRKKTKENIPQDKSIIRETPVRATSPILVEEIVGKTLVPESPAIEQNQKDSTMECTSPFHEFQYHQTVRGKEQRKRLHAFDCKNCQEASFN